MNHNNNEYFVKGLKIDPQIFTFKFSCNCKGECCYYGVYADFYEYEKILSVKDDLKLLMDDSQSKNEKDWFEKPEVDKDFESGIAVGTQIINIKCSFLDKNGLCVLQKLSLTTNENKWKYKPIYCVLFPLTIWQGMLTIDDEHLERLKSCNKSFSQKTIFNSCKDELIHFFGDEGFNELLEIEKKILNSKNLEVINELAK